jgi:DNA-binding CsgD family transcriptional regulator
VCEAKRHEEALQSALGRLPVAVFVVDGDKVLRPFNAQAMHLMEVEGLAGDLVMARPSHPLSQLIQSLLRDPNLSSLSQVLLSFSSGTRYVVEPSRRSEKQLKRWLLLLMHKLHETHVDVLPQLEEWKLTDKEREVAMMMARGARTEAILDQLQIAATTLKTHVRGLLRKSGSRTRSDFLAKLLSGPGS